jgi:hypothetical protein
MVLLNKKNAKQRDKGNKIPNKLGGSKNKLALK